MASLTNQHGHGGACPHSDMTGTPPDACPASKCPAQTTSSSTAAKTTAASSCPYKGGAGPHSDMTGTPPDACPASKCPAQMQKVGGGVGPAFTRGEIEPPAGEKDMGSSKAAVYTKEQQDRLNVDEQGQKIKKSEWPELVGKNGEEAVETIKRERPDLVSVATMPQGMMMTMDMRMDRVRVMIDGDGNVTGKPALG